MTYAAVVACAYWLHAVKDATPIQSKVIAIFYNQSLDTLSDSRIDVMSNM